MNEKNKEKIENQNEGGINEWGILTREEERTEKINNVFFKNEMFVFYPSLQ